MELRPHRVIKRKKTKEIKVGNISVGGNSVISVQSMTNTLTTDVESTINQINSLLMLSARIMEIKNIESIKIVWIILKNQLKMLEKLLIQEILN